jgi:hypothetical protein
MPDSDLSDDLLILLRRLQAERPGSWLEDVADAVVAVGGTDGADLLAMAADRAASGLTCDADAGAADPEQALQAMEAELRADPLKDPNLDVPTPTPTQPKSPARSMDS